MRRGLCGERVQPKWARQTCGPSQAYDLCNERLDAGGLEEA